MPVHYTDCLEGITPARLQGFFVGWPDPPHPAVLLAILQHSDEVVLAVDGEGGPVVGFITALTDGVLTAYLPLLEVLPAHQAKGVGTELMRRMLARLEGLYAVDLVCDEELVPFYARFGFRSGRAMLLRDYRRQAGR